MPLIQLAGQLDDIATHVDQGVLQYEDGAAVACVHNEMWLAAHRLIHVLETTPTVEDDVSAAA